MNAKSWGTAVLMLAMLMTAATLADDQDDEAREHATAKRVLPTAKVSLTDAIKIALVKIPGSKVVEAELEDSGTTYMVEAIPASGKHMQAHINLTSGAVESIAEEKPGGEAEQSEEAAEAATAKASISLLAAIDLAQKRVPGGKAFEASSEMDGDKAIFSIEFLLGDKFIEVEVDPMSGRVLEIEEES